jgi:hypothetical protein
MATDGLTDEQRERIDAVAIQWEETQAAGAGG